MVLFKTFYTVSHEPNPSSTAKARTLEYDSPTSPNQRKNKNQPKPSHIHVPKSSVIRPQSSPVSPKGLLQGMPTSILQLSGAHSTPTCPRNLSTGPVRPLASVSSSRDGYLAADGLPERHPNLGLQRAQRRSYLDTLSPEISPI